MCTVSIIATGDGYRLVHSRDEQRTREPGRPPEIRRAGPYRTIAPVDPEGGGTWVLARDDGLTVAIMNVNPEPPPGIDRASLRSRGLIIPDLAGRAADEIPDFMAALDVSRYAPFRLIAVARPGCRVRVQSWTWRGRGVLESSTPRPPVCWVSSGLGDSVVADRLPLFDEVVRTDPTPAAQEGFHRYLWPGRGAESVLMSRPDARTVSLTAVEAGPRGVRMLHSPVDESHGPGGAGGPGEILEPVVVALP